MLDELNHGFVSGVVACRVLNVRVEAFDGFFNELFTVLLVPMPVVLSKRECRCHRLQQRSILGVRYVLVDILTICHFL